MLQPTLRIYLTANIIVYLLFAFAAFPEGLGFGFIAMLCAALFSAPTLFVLFGCFRLIRQLQPGLVGSWLLLSLAVCICAFVPMAMLSLESAVDMSLDKDFLAMCFGCGSTGTLLQCFYVNKYFKFIHHEAESGIENN